MSLLLEFAFKISIVVLMALVANVLLRKQSAATRHWVLSVAIVCAAAMPLLQPLMPSWQLTVGAPAPPNAVVERPPATDLSANLFVSVESESRASGIFGGASMAMIGDLVAPIWMAGFAISLVILLVGFARLSWIAARSRALEQGTWTELTAEISGIYGLRRPVVLLQSDHPTLLVTWGHARPKVILPSAARDWPEDRVRLVLYHELAHIKRGDWVIQMMAELVRSAFWFNPLLWIVCRRLREESEHACDDAVLARGIEGSDYATELLALARVLNARQPWFPAPAMARPSSLERRVSAMLNSRINRYPMTRFARVITVVALAALTLPIAALAQATFSTFSGSVLDPSDALLPATNLILTNSQTKAKYQVSSNREGRFEFVGLPPGQYTLETELPGFASVHATLTIAGQDLQQDVKLQVASLEETVTVTDDGGSAPQPPQTATRPALPNCVSAPVARGIGGNIKPPMKIRNINPSYPQNVPDAKAEEIVILNARVGTDGRIEDVGLVGSANPAFADAAIAAVRQWEFTETLLNCVPIQVSLKVRVTFQPRRAAAAHVDISVQITFPNGARPVLRGESNSHMTVSHPDLGAFGFRPTLTDPASGLVTIVLLEGTKPDGRVLGEASMRAGDPPVYIGSAPSFGVAVLSIR